MFISNDQGVTWQGPFPGFGGTVGLGQDLAVAHNGDRLLVFHAGYWHMSMATPFAVEPKLLEQYREGGLPEVDAPLAYALPDGEAVIAVPAAPGVPAAPRSPVYVVPTPAPDSPEPVYVVPTPVVEPDGVPTPDEAPPAPPAPIRVRGPIIEL